MVWLYADYYEKKFKVPACSVIAFFWLMFLLLAIVVPYVFCYATNGKLINLNYRFLEKVRLLL